MKTKLTLSSWVIWSGLSHHTPGHGPPVPSYPRSWTTLVTNGLTHLGGHPHAGILAYAFLRSSMSFRAEVLWEPGISY